MSVGRPISEEDLHAYVDELLPPARHAEVTAYLAQHAEIARRIADYAAQRRALRGALAAIAVEPVPTALTLARLIEARPRPRPWRSVAAACVMFALGAAGGWSLREHLLQAPGSVAALAQDALHSYQAYGPDPTHPVEIAAADSAELISWFSHRLNRVIAAPDLSAAGYRFMGGRLVATADGPAGLFMYDDARGTRLVMLMRPMADRRTVPMSEQDAGPIAGFAWGNAGLAFSLVGPTMPEVLHPLANEARTQLNKTI